MVWIIEWDTPTYGHIKAVKRVMYQGRSKYQEIWLVETYEFGKLLLLDGKSQSSEHDEFVYHEALVHPAMLLHPRPQRVLILGGGEGATLREVLKHRSVEEVVMVDIDEDVVKVSRELWGELSAGAFEDPRVRLIIGDALDYIFGSPGKFDVIIADLSDPLEAGPAYKLYTLETYRRIAELLDGGVFVTQAASPTNTPQTHAIIYNTARSAFRFAAYYHAFMNSFSGMWGFVIASNELDPRGMRAEEAERRLRERGVATRFYDAAAHLHMFSVPRHLRELIERERRVSTMSSPAYMPA
ncbi:MAG: polyamine aminopropyltransferase [Acidilobaceae archaeon]|nr:polyamine aminopropyltransferase [Acidilobaceae archaeon]